VIREFYFDRDIKRMVEIHAASGLPPECLPNLEIVDQEKNITIPNPLYIVKAVMEHEDRPAMMCFLKLTAEIYLLVDHSIGTPEKRWEWLQEFTNYIARSAWEHGLEQLTCWVPQEIEESFAKRLKDLGFRRSPWTSYTLNLED